jgi:hypothetical protein
MNRDDHSYIFRTRQPVPWRIGFGCTDNLLDGAHAAAQAFGVEPHGHVMKASIGDRFVGYLYKKDLKLIAWPHVGEEYTRERHVERMHQWADMDDKGVCYFIGGDVGAVKIGFTIDIKSRLRTIQANSPIPLRVLATRSGGETRERAYHCQFDEHRLHYEWFTRSPEIEAEISRLNPLPAITRLNGGES